MDGIDAQLAGNGVHDRDKDVHGGVGIHEATCDQEDDVDDQQEDKLVAGDIQQQSLSSLGDAVNGTDVREDGSGTDDNHDGAGGLTGVHQNTGNILPLHLTINEQADDHSVDNGNCSGLSGSEDTAVDTAQNDDGNHESPEGLTEGLQALAPGSLFTGTGQALAAGLNHDQDDQSQTHHDTGDNTAHEHITNGFAGNGGVNDEGDGGGNNNRDGGCSSHHGCREVGGKAAAVDHSGDQNDTQCSDSGGTGTGNSAEETGNDDADDGDTASTVTDTVVDKANQASGDTGLGHDVTGQHEEGDGQQQELCHTAIDIGGNDGETVAGKQHGKHRGHTQADADGDVQKQQHEERAKQDNINHYASSSSFLDRKSMQYSMVCSSRNTQPMGRKTVNTHSGSIKEGVRLPLAI